MCSSENDVLLLTLIRPLVRPLWMRRLVSLLVDVSIDMHDHRSMKFHLPPKKLTSVCSRCSDDEEDSKRCRFLIGLTDGRCDRNLFLLPFIISLTLFTVARDSSATIPGPFSEVTRSTHFSLLRPLSSSSMGVHDAQSLVFFDSIDQAVREQSARTVQKQF